MSSNKKDNLIFELNEIIHTVELLNLLTKKTILKLIKLSLSEMEVELKNA